MPKPKMAEYEVLDDNWGAQVAEATGANGPVVININTVNVNNGGYVNSGYNGELYSNKSRAATLILALIFGVFGAHCFYVGRIGRGILFFFTLGLFGFGLMWDIIMIALGRYRDGAGWLIVT